MNDDERGAGTGYSTDDAVLDVVLSTYYIWTSCSYRGTDITSWRHREGGEQQERSSTERHGGLALLHRMPYGIFRQVPTNTAGRRARPVGIDVS